MVNKLNRFIPDNYKPYVSSHDYKNSKRVLIEEKKINNKIVFIDSME